MKGLVIYHWCDTVVGSSGSMLATMENGALRIRGIHSNSLDVNRLEEKDKAKEYMLNEGTSSSLVLDLIRIRFASPEPRLLASYIQWLLQRAGCYSGKLDNQWGPGSRKALAAFATAAAITLPGTEPSAELLAAVEKAAPEGTEVCR